MTGVTLIARQRKANVACWGRRRWPYRWIYGGKKGWRTPKYLLLDEKEKDQYVDKYSGLKIPKWLTLQKWESWTCKRKARSVQYWTMIHDENGNLDYDENKQYSVTEAVRAHLRMNARAPLTFDGSVEFVAHMNLDPRNSDQQLRTTVVLPHGTGKEVKMAVFCTEEEEEEVKALGVTLCGSELTKAIENEEFDFEVMICKPQMMPRLAKLGRILGPRKLMPSPKTGTVVTDYASAIESFQKGKLVLRMTDRSAMIMVPAGRLSFGEEKLVENFEAILDCIIANKPPGAKKIPRMFKKLYMGSTMSPTMSINIADWNKKAAKAETP